MDFDFIVGLSFVRKLMPLCPLAHKSPVVVFCCLSLSVSLLLYSTSLWTVGLSHLQATQWIRITSPSSPFPSVQIWPCFPHLVLRSNTSPTGAGPQTEGSVRPTTKRQVKRSKDKTPAKQWDFLIALLNISFSGWGRRDGLFFNRKLFGSDKGTFLPRLGKVS